MGLFGRKKDAFDPNGPLRLWMSDGEYGQIRAILESVRPKAVVEWGSGGSTKFFLADHPFIERYVSVEHDGAWVDKVRGEVEDPRLEYHLVEPDVPCPAFDWHKPKERAWFKAWKARAETDPSVMASYIAKPSTLLESCDLAFVDGRARSFCIREGFRLLRPGGVVVLHDAEREEYHAAMNGCGRAVFLPGWELGQVAMVRKG